MKKFGLIAVLAAAAMLAAPAFAASTNLTIDTNTSHLGQINLGLNVGHNLALDDTNATSIISATASGINNANLTAQANDFLQVNAALDLAGGTKGWIHDTMTNAAGVVDATLADVGSSSSVYAGAEVSNAIQGNLGIELTKPIDGVVDATKTNAAGVVSVTIH